MNQLKVKELQQTEYSPFSDQNNVQDTTQKRDFPELHLLYKEKEDLIKWLFEQLQIAQKLCTQIVSVKNREQIKDFQELKRILDESLEKAKNQWYSKETSVNPFDSPQKFNCDQEIIDSGIKIKSQDKLINNPTDTKLKQNMFNSQMKYHSSNSQKQICQNASDYKETPQQQDEDQFQETISSGYFINSVYGTRAKKSFMQLKSYQLQLQEEYKIFKSEFQNYLDVQQEYIQNDIKTIMFQFKNEIQNLQPNTNLQQTQKQVIIVQQNSQISQQQLSTIYCHLSQYKKTIIELKKEFQNLKQKLENQNKQFSGTLEKEQEKFKEKLSNIINQNKSYIAKIKDLSDNLSITQKKNEDQKKFIQKLEKELDQQKQQYQELQNKIQDETSLQQFDDSNICSLLRQFEQNQRQACQNGNQAFEKLQMMEELNQQVNQIKKAVMKDYENQIDNQGEEIKNQQLIIQKLQMEKKQLEENIRQNNCQGILNDALQKVSDQEKKNYDLSIEINKKANQITFLKEQIQSLNEFVYGKQNEIKRQLMDQYENIIKLQLEGCYNLQQLSILFSFLGLKIFRQYIISENSNKTQIDLTIEKLNNFNSIYQRKENQNLKESKEIDKYYKDYFNQLKDIYDETLQQFKRLLKEIQDRRIKAQ